MSSRSRSQATEALLETSRVMTAVVALTLADVPDAVAVQQLRVLVMLDSRGSMNLGAVAAGLGVNPSNATRTCDKLVDTKLIARTVDPEDRRRGVLKLTRRGAGLVSSLMDARRTVLDDLVARMPAAARADLVQGLDAFLAVVERGLDDEILGEPSGSILRWVK